MRLFHVSEEPDIRVFEPRYPTRKDLDPNIGLVWAIDEERLPTFLTPRDCPRVAYYVSEHTTAKEREKFFTSPENTHVLILESGWYSRLQNTALYLYEFDPKDFILQDAVAGYYVAQTTQYPIAKFALTNLMDELIGRNVEVRFVNNLWHIADAVKTTNLNWSLCRMAYAVARQNKEK